MRYFYILLIAMCSQILSVQIQIGNIEEKTNKNYVVMGIIDLNKKKCVFKQAYRDALPGINQKLKQWTVPFPVETYNTFSLFVCINRNGSKSIFVCENETDLEKEINAQELKDLYLRPDIDLTYLKPFQNIQNRRKNYEVIKDVFRKKISASTLQELFSEYEKNETEIAIKEIIKERVDRIYKESILNDRIDFNALILSLEFDLRHIGFLSEKQLFEEVIGKFDREELKKKIREYTTNNPDKLVVIQKLQTYL